MAETCAGDGGQAGRPARPERPACAAGFCRPSASRCWLLRHGRTVEPFGDTGAPLEGLAFHHYWLRAGGALARTGAPLEAWSLAAQAAARGRFGAAQRRSPLAALDPGPRPAAGWRRLRRRPEGRGAEGRGRAHRELSRGRPGGRRVRRGRRRGLGGIGAPGCRPGRAWRASRTGSRPSPTTPRCRLAAGSARSRGTRWRSAPALACLGAADGGDLHLLQTTVLAPGRPAADRPRRHRRVQPPDRPGR
ncbi:tryptophan 7-halogenase [Caulobacter segnis]